MSEFKAKFLRKVSSYVTEPGKGEWTGYLVDFNDAAPAAILYEMRYRAECKVSHEYIPVNRLQWTQSKQETEQAHIEEFKQLISVEKGIEAVLVVTYNGGKSYKLSDGHHRVSACEHLGFKTVPAILVSVDYGDDWKIK